MAWGVLSRAAEMTWDVMFGVTKTAGDVVSVFARKYPRKWDVLSRVS